MLLSELELEAGILACFIFLNVSVLVQVALWIEMRLGLWQSGHLGALFLSSRTLIRAWLVPSVGDTTM